jgi:hypothetical protein
MTYPTTGPIAELLESLLEPASRSGHDPDFLERASRYQGRAPRVDAGPDAATPNRDEIRYREAQRHAWAKRLTGESWLNDGYCYDLATWSPKPVDQYTKSEIDQLTAAITAYLAAI